MKADYRQIPRLDNPKYYSHFTISRYADGRFILQNYPESTTWMSLLKNGTDVETGYYMMVSGSRMASGSVLGEIAFFNVEKGKTTAATLTMRDNPEDIRVIGNFNSESLFTLPETGEQTSVLKLQAEDIS